MKKQQLLQNLLLLSLTTLFSLLMIEVLYRFYLFGFRSFSVSKMNSVHPIGTSGLIQTSPYRELIYELKPKVKTHFKMAELETNSQGLRDQEYSITKPKNTLRIAVVGDSFTMPSGVTLEEAYHTVLENKLNEKPSGLSYEVINFGVGGYSLRQYWAMIKHRVINYQPDLILVGFCPDNDYDVLPEEYFQTPYKVKRETYPFFESIILSYLQEYRKNIKLSYQNTISQKKKDYVQTYFAKMGNFSQQNKIPILVVFLARQPLEHSQLTEKLATENKLYFLDINPAFTGKNLNEYNIYPIDTHPNGKAHKIFAEQIYNYLHNTRLLDNMKP